MLAKRFVSSKNRGGFDENKLDRGEAVLRKHLRTFEENQISNIIRRIKGKRTLKFHQFYNIQRQKIPERIRISLENHSSPTENSKKTSFSTKNL